MEPKIEEYDPLKTDIAKIMNMVSKIERLHEVAGCKEKIGESIRVSHEVN